MTRFIELELRALTRGQVKTDFGPLVGDVWGVARPVQVNPDHIICVLDMTGDEHGCVIHFSHGQKALLEKWSAADLAAVLHDDVSAASHPPGDAPRTSADARSGLRRFAPGAKPKGKGK